MPALLIMIKDNMHRLPPSQRMTSQPAWLLFVTFGNVISNPLCSPLYPLPAVPPCPSPEHLIRD